MSNYHFYVVARDGGGGYLCDYLRPPVPRSFSEWFDRAHVTCAECQLLIAVAEANDITPATYYAKLGFTNPREICTFRGAIEWIMNQANK